LFFAHPVLAWFETETAAVEEDCRCEVIAASEATATAFD
jgi:hypothetical protein